jgi:pimeloyl-ACP methyl ester carboxylesterase
MNTIATRTLEIAYEEFGGPSQPAVVLLHGWPDDAHTWRQIAHILAPAGFRVLCPYLRGFGKTRFVSDKTSRSGQLSAFSSDLLDFADALRLRTFSVVGHDWGARAAYIASVLKPERISACIAITVGRGTNDPGQSLSWRQTRNFWYHWLFSTSRGEKALRENRRELTRFLWSSWAPSWKFTESEFNETAASFENPDWVGITLSSYRHRWGWAPGDPAYERIEASLNPAPRISVPTLMIQGDEDGANLPESSEHKQQLFSGPYSRLLVSGAGHFVQREKPSIVAKTILNWLDAYTDKREALRSA